MHTYRPTHWSSAVTSHCSAVSFINRHNNDTGREQTNPFDFSYVHTHKKPWAVMSKRCNLHEYQAIRHPCYQYNDLHGANTPGGDIYFWQLEQIKTYIRPYVTIVSATQSSTFQHQPLNLCLLYINNAKYITHWQQSLLPQFMFQQPHSTKDNLYLSMQALCDAFKVRRGGICSHLICLVWVGKTMGASGAMHGFLSEAPGVMLCDFPFSLYGNHSRLSPPTAWCAGTPPF